MSDTAKKNRNNIKRLVLIVEDELVNRRLLGFIIDKDYDVIYAENGKEALELIKKYESTLSIILLDLIMPVMDGYEVLEIVRADAKLSKIPVIVLTSERSAEVKSLQLGAADFIPKPYDMPEVILARVRRSIELAEDSSIINATENDALTGLYTKHFFFQHARRRDQYYPDADMDAVVINVNRFHLVNELHGRLFGDTVICTIAGKIHGIIEESNGIACRCDADSFYIYIEHREDYNDLLARLSEELTEVTGNSRISVRIGIYQCADKSVDIEERFDRAVLACNTRRSNYASGFALYDDGMHKKELYSERLMSDMDGAVDGRQFMVYFQPKFNIKGDKPVLASAEALIRWQHPEYGMVSPGTFIPLFEENGLVQKVDRFVWRETAAQIKRWKDKFGVTIPISVNVSRMEIYDPGLEDELLTIVNDNGLIPSEYLLEITESAYTDNSDQIVETVKKLRNDGFKVEMDDFGAGYSSLNMLATLPIDALKLDMQFIRNICQSEKDAHMVELMIEVAGFLSVPVIAEGVENEEQYRLLKKIGCDIIQGFYFSKPVPPEEFEKFIIEKLKDEEEGA